MNNYDILNTVMNHSLSYYYLINEIKILDLIFKAYEGVMTLDEGLEIIHDLIECGKRGKEWTTAFSEVATEYIDMFEKKLHP